MKKGLPCGFNGNIVDKFVGAAVAIDLYVCVHMQYD